MSTSSENAEQSYGEQAHKELLTLATAAYEGWKKGRNIVGPMNELGRFLDGLPATPTTRYERAEYILMAIRGRRRGAAVRELMKVLSNTEERAALAGAEYLWSIVESYLVNHGIPKPNTAKIATRVREEFDRK